MNDKLKIAFVNKFFFLKGGSEKVMFDEAHLLEQNGHQVEYFSMHHPNNPESYEYSKYFVDYVELSNAGKEYSIFDKIKIAKNLIYNKQAEINFERFINDFKPDIIHCHNISSQISPSVLRVAKKYNIPAVMTMHDYQLVCPNYTFMYAGQEVCQDYKCMGAKYFNCLLNKCSKGSYSASLISTVQMYFNYYTKSYTGYLDKLISPSEFLKNIMVESGISNDKVKFIPNFVSINEFNPEYSNEGYFLYAGRLSFEKGVKTLLKAFKQLPDTGLKIVGTGPLEEELFKFKEENEITNVSFEGYQSGENLKELFKNCIGLIIPSEWHENAPMTIIEAFASGKPVIGTKLGGIPEMVEQDKTGFLFEPKNDLELAEKVKELSLNPDKVVEMGKQARKKAESIYNSAYHYENLMEIYNLIK